MVDFYSERQAAGYLGLSLDLLRHEVNQGRLAKHSRGFRSTDLDDWKRRLPKMLAGRMPDMDLRGVPRTERHIERSLRASGLRKAAPDQR